jgi:hypothetical protein
VEGRDVIRAILTFIVVFFVLALLLSVLGWAGPGEVLLLLVASAVAAVAVTRLRIGAGRTNAQ